MCFHLILGLVAMCSCETKLSSSMESGQTKACNPNNSSSIGYHVYQFPKVQCRYPSEFAQRMRYSYKMLRSSKLHSPEKTAPQLKLLEHVVREPGLLSNPCLVWNAGVLILK